MLKAYEIHTPEIGSGIRAFYAAESAGQAKALVAETLIECGYYRTHIEAWENMRCIRAYHLDSNAITKCKPGILP